MIRNSRGIVAALTLIVVLGADNRALADGPLRLQATGVGLFSPANIGQKGQPGAQIIFGDGSGLSSYKASGTDFRLNGHQFGQNTHLGAVQSFTSGIAQMNGSVVWPAEVAPNPYIPHHQRVHVMDTKLGKIFFTYNKPPTHFVLFPAQNEIQGLADLHAVGGTGRFHEASGLIKVVVTSNLATDVTPQGVKFKYVFDGMIKIGDDDARSRLAPARPTTLAPRRR